MQNIQRTLSFIGPECPQSSSSERASSAIVRRWLLRLASFALAVVTLGTLGVPTQAQGFFEKGSTPSFTASQVERGKVAYASSCLVCHDANLDGSEFGPALKGASFTKQWGNQSPAALFSIPNGADATL